MNRLVTAMVAGFAAAGGAGASTTSFVTAPNATVTPVGSGVLPVSAATTFTTSTDTLLVWVTNLTIETGGIGQTINSIDFLMSTPSAGPTVVSWSGNAINLADPGKGSAHLVGYSQIAGGYGSFGSAGQPVQRWNTVSSGQIGGGYSLTTITGGNPAETIIGPENAPGQYEANKSMFADNPFLQTPTSSSHIAWVIHFTPGSGVTANTVVTRVRLTWGTGVDTATEVELLNESPEPGTIALGVSGALVLAVLRRRKNQEPR